MNILVFALVVVIVAALLIWALDSVPVPSPLNWILRVAVILIAALIILNQLGYV